MNRQSSTKKLVAFCLVASFFILISKTAGLGQEQISLKQRLVGYPELASPKVWIPKKDFYLAKQLLHSEIKARKIKTYREYEKMSQSSGVALPSLEASQLNMALDIEGKPDNVHPDLVVFGNDWAVRLAQILDKFANDSIAESDYLRAKALLESAITVTKDTGRKVVDLEKYQKDYSDLLSKINQQKATFSKPKA